MECELMARGSLLLLRKKDQKNIVDPEVVVGGALLCG
jgi:hypothetical protein